MPTINILTIGVKGVDMKSNPLSLGPLKMASAVNGTFEEGIFRTRPGFDYHSLGFGGQFQGACVFSPARGISAFSFAADETALIIAAEGRVYLNDTTSGFISCDPMELTEEATFLCSGEVNVFPAENYLIIQNRSSDTYWWSSDGLVKSPGMTPDCYWENPPVQVTLLE